MTLDSFIEETKKLVSEEIHHYCRKIALYPLPNAEFSAQKIEEFTMQGKMIRAVLVRLSAESFSAEKCAEAISVGAALELAQSSLLIHDDVMDNDSLRRGKPTIHKQYEQELSEIPSASDTGKSLAVCLGDVILFFLFSQIADNPKIVELFSEELAKTALGQACDIRISSTDIEISREDILTIIENKTARYTFRLPLLSGAILASREQELRPVLERFSLLAGYIFQIRDDELNFISSNTTGKTSGGDIRENKKTLCRYELISEYPEAQKLFGTTGTIEAVQKLYRNSKAQKIIRNQVETFTQEASSILDSLPINPKFKPLWYELLTYLTQRNI